MIRRNGFMQRLTNRRKQRGASLVEFVVAFPVFAILGLGAYQWTQIYEMKTAVNHAAFMAARAGSLYNGDPTVMRGTFAEYLAPLYAPDSASTTDLIAVTGVIPSSNGTRCAAALPGSGLACDDVVNHSRIRTLNPTQEAFDDFGDDIDNDGNREIPNLDLHLRDTDVGGSSGLNIQDANLLKIEIVYGAPLRVPFVNYIFAYVVNAFTDPGSHEAQINAISLNPPRIPIRSSSLVRMQTPIREHNDLLARNDAEDIVDTLGEPVDRQPGTVSNPWGGPTGDGRDGPFVCGCGSC